MDYIKTNKASWDKRTGTHVTSKFYDVKGFLEGKCVLNSIELSELGDVSGKELLHLQCHFGLDTLSWARRGAVVTGVDLSSAAIAMANEIKAKAGLKATFICSDLYHYGAIANTAYDIVFTSYGVVCWLPCIKQWAEVVTKSLNPGGTFYMAEFHPVYDIAAGYSYFHNSQPDITAEGTYTENNSGEKSTFVTWTHPLSDVINALISAGIKIEQLNEYPYSPYNCFDGMEEREQGKFYISQAGHDIPLIYTIKGTKSA